MKRCIYILLFLAFSVLTVSCAASSEPKGDIPDYNSGVISPEYNTDADEGAHSPYELFKFEWNERYEGYFVYENEGNQYSYVVIPETYNGKPVVGIGKFAFNSYSKVQRVVIPNNVVVIETQAFNYCNYLEQVEFKDGSQLEIIKESAFYNCRSLISVFVPKNVQMIGNRAFSTCPELNEITVDMNNEYYSSGESALYSKDGRMLIAVAPAVKMAEFVVPDGVVAISDGAFRDCIFIERIFIPKSVKSLGSNIIGAFVKEINYAGTVEEWESVRKESKWNEKAQDYTVNCLDGTVSK